MQENVRKLFEFRGRKCRVERCRYPGGGEAWLVRDTATEEPVTVATVKIEGMAVERGEVLIREGGMAAALEKAGLIERTGNGVLCGGIMVERCRVIEGRGR